MASFEIKSYTATVSSYPDFGWILLLGDNGIKAKLEFKPMSGSTSSSLSASGSYIKSIMDVRFFDTIVDLLRNEKPLYFYWFTSSGWCAVTTGPEPVGENEAPGG